jgi:alkylated DNA repair dioxygenase AlkB
MIPGLRYVPGYLDSGIQDALLASVDAGEWRGFVQRRVQIYGYTCNPMKGIHRTDDLPPWAQQLAARLERDGLMPEVADQLIVNDYAPGQGIHPHVDGPFFADTIVSISLGSSCIMEFSTEAGAREEQFLEPMSALVIAGEARNGWKHAVPAREQDVWDGRVMPRARRVSLTFKRMRLQDPVPRG